MEYTHLGSDPGHTQRGGTTGGNVVQSLMLDVPPSVRAGPPQGISTNALTYLLGGRA